MMVYKKFSLCSCKCEDTCYFTSGGTDKVSYFAHHLEARYISSVQSKCLMRTCACGVSYLKQPHVLVVGAVGDYRCHFVLTPLAWVSALGVHRGLDAVPYLPPVFGFCDDPTKILRLFRMPKGISYVAAEETSYRPSIYQLSVDFCRYIVIMKHRTIVELHFQGFGALVVAYGREVGRRY